MLVIEKKHFAFSYITKHKNSKQIPRRNEHNPLTSYLVLLISITKMFTISSSFFLHIQTKIPRHHCHIITCINTKSHYHQACICTLYAQTPCKHPPITLKPPSQIMKGLVGYHLSLCHDIHYFFSTDRFTQF